ncbi:MAG: lytic murein transglycosylase B [Gammaproteobacteria bacterium CG_4_10_14_0_8_um_filter_38_16]|nr:MAG: lytic murein transglycosylase B [Gammaproteobacteria bacterium CG_4_10_14_0_8_um_filter_38_16]PJA04010.1 MAG: lytic murein transglycosylase B [Gammaproteobacteria bacterium CG_4_10_14_0_2_um_filter_38_22]PJB11022.1 MAG: lytic murein transglycosylase B [Gammaproteobacteria bacterium CG_4_9_14_3_um_filter_38_9]
MSGKLVLFVGSCMLSWVAFASPITTHSHEIKQAKKTFTQQLVTQDHFNRTQLTHLLSTLHPNPRVIACMTQPFEKQPWVYYRHFFVTPRRVALGAQYLKNHHHVLMQMQKKYGIPASIITAIVGVETEYGLHLGRYSVLRSLYTLAFYYPPREIFFRNELGQYLILTRDNHLNAGAIKGSYAGALGIPQFMPSSYRYFGVSLKKNTPVNLFHNNDAIASVANYFHKNGWHANQPIARKLQSKYTHIDQRIGTRLTLPMKNHTQYWEIYHNFNVIMTYNHNVVYAMAVYQLSQAIEKRYAHLKK